ncbi:hypothetical protein [Lapillicoccus sp.]|uniref:hypothetical protein n=1 Tax=Lapillicoccus sp. TaxID=1909287 RepID=UPI003267EB9E
MTFAHFTVRVDEATGSEAQGYLVRARVCVTSLPPGSTDDTTRISWDPWTVLAATGSSKSHLYDGSHPPSDMYPQSAQYAAGQCAAGYIPFSDQNSPTLTVDYRNELGDHAQWKAH